MALNTLHKIIVVAAVVSAWCYCCLCKANFRCDSHLIYSKSISSYVPRKENKKDSISKYENWFLIWISINNQLLEVGVCNGCAAEAMCHQCKIIFLKN